MRRRAGRAARGALRAPCPGVQESLGPRVSGVAKEQGAGEAPPEGPAVPQDPGKEIQVAHIGVARVVRPKISAARRNDGHPGGLGGAEREGEEEEQAGEGEKVQGPPGRRRGR